MQNSGRQLTVERDAADSGSDWQLAVEVWPAALALAVSVCCATLFFPFFTYCPSSGLLQALLPQVRPLCAGTSTSKDASWELYY